MQSYYSKDNKSLSSGTKSKLQLFKFKLAITYILNNELILLLFQDIHDILLYFLDKILTYNSFNLITFNFIL